MSNGQYEINIIVSTDTKGKGGTNYNYSTTADTSETDTSKQRDETRQQILGVVASQAANLGKQALSFGIANYGNWSGDYVAQANMTAAANLISTGVGFGVAAAAGGPVGLAIAVAGKVASLGFKELGAAIDRSNRNRRTSVLRERVGMDSGGSR